MYDTAILFNNFNRPESTAKVLQSIKFQKPKKLFVHCDGPRPDVPDDLPKVQAVRQLILKEVDWECDLKLLFRDENLGCGRGPASAMSWFFEQVEDGIILEDDCLPHPDFFQYCQELLDKYRYNTDIYIISGSNLNITTTNKYSYGFTKYAGIWGWATWKRTWQFFDFDFSISENEFRQQVAPFLRNKYAEKYWIDILRKVNMDNNRTYWDYQLHLIMLLNRALHIRPTQNLITNIGFDEYATHTMNESSWMSNQKTYNILPLNHPEQIIVNKKMDQQSFDNSLNKQIKRFIKNIIQYAR